MCAVKPHRTNICTRLQYIKAIGIQHFNKWTRFSYHILVVYEAQELIGKAVLYCSKLKAIDSIETPEFPAADPSRIIGILITTAGSRRYCLAPTTILSLKRK
ncbi:MAG: hypothetical protein WA667_07465 [Candidatus Nitrosopolaris sp.]